MADIKIPITSVTDGSVQAEQLVKLGTLATVMGIHDRSNDGQFVYIKKIKILDLFPFDVVRLIVSLGGEVSSYPVFIKVPDAKYNTPVPSFMPNATGKLWSTYKDSRHEHHPKDGFVYIESNPFGDAINASDYLQLEPDYELLTVSEYQAL